MAPGQARNVITSDGREVKMSMFTRPSTLAFEAEGLLGRPRCVGKRPPSSENSGTSTSQCRSLGAANGPECFARSLARNSEPTTRLTPAKPRRQLTTSALATATRAFQGDGFATSEPNAPAQLASGPRDLAASAEGSKNKMYSDQQKKSYALKKTDQKKENQA